MTRALWVAVVLLAGLGTYSAVLRSVYRSDLMHRIEPVRTDALAALGIQDPFAGRRSEELARADGRFASRPVRTVLHTVAGGLFLLIAPLQFSARIRNRHPRWHRWSGRILLTLAVPTVLTGMYFGILQPYGGPGEMVLIALVGTMFLVAAGRAFVAIRRREVARHREWMIRTFAVAISISTVRVVAAGLDLALTPAGIQPPDIFVLSLWIGWGVTLGAAELWIRHTRASPGWRPPDAEAMPDGAASLDGDTPPIAAPGRRG